MNLLSRSLICVLHAGIDFTMVIDTILLVLSALAYYQHRQSYQHNSGHTLVTLMSPSKNNSTLVPPSNLTWEQFSQTNYIQFGSNAGANTALVYTEDHFAEDQSDTAAGNVLTRIMWLSISSYSMRSLRLVRLPTPCWTHVK